MTLKKAESQTNLKRKYPRVQIDYSAEKCITDQAAAVDLSMQSIIAKLEKGIMPNLRSGLVYTTDLGVRNLQDVHRRQKQVDDLFYQLPTEIRAAMGNNIQNFESFVFNPKNRELLQKHDFIVEKKDTHSELLFAIQSLKPDTAPNEQKPPKA